MRALAFSKRCAKEILRDPLNLIFGLGFPICLILLLSAIQANIPTKLFEIERLCPGICVFGMSFITLFSATLVARDRESAFLERLYTTPLESRDYIIGYILPLLPMAVAESAVCCLVSLPLGLPFNMNIIYSLFATIPTAILYISLGLLCGSIFNVKQVGGICGALLTNLSAWLSGIWFDISLVGGIFQKIANLLPFYHAVELQRAVVAGDISLIITDLFVVLGYAVVISIAAVLLFFSQMKKK